jgi:hypothetical protein
MTLWTVRWAREFGSNQEVRTPQEERGYGKLNMKGKTERNKKAVCPLKPHILTCWRRRVCMGIDSEERDESLKETCHPAQEHWMIRKRVIVFRILISNS